METEKTARARQRGTELVAVLRPLIPEGWACALVLFPRNGATGAPICAANVPAREAVDALRRYLGTVDRDVPEANGGHDDRHPHGPTSVAGRE